VTHPVLWFVVPEGVDDPARVSGGNVFDRRLADGLRALGWDVRWLATAAGAADEVLATVPSGGLVLIDGLVALGAPAAVEEAARRLRVALIAHMVAGAFADAERTALDAERRALAVAGLVVVTSRWTGEELVARGLVGSERVIVATPGSDDAPLSNGTVTGGSLLCVGVVAPHKGQDLLIDALAALGAGWTCTIAGSVAADPGFAERVAARAAAAGLAERITWAGVVDRPDLDALYARADLLVAPSRTESFGLAVADALRRGVPVIAHRVGGIPEAVRPGRAAILVAPEHPVALHRALHRWMTEPSLRAALTAEARREGPRRAPWSDTAVRVDRALRRLA
jgi:hypothetical protein